MILNDISSPSISTPWAIGVSFSGVDASACSKDYRPEQTTCKTGGAEFQTYSRKYRE